MIVNDTYIYITYVRYIYIYKYNEEKRIDA